MKSEETILQLTSDIFTTVAPGDAFDVAGELQDKVGRAGHVVDDDLPIGDVTLPLDLSFGDLGRLLDVTFDDSDWTDPVTFDGACDALLSPVVDPDVGLFGTGFTLVETGQDSGIFVGDFAVPSIWCRAGELTPETTTGKDLEVTYNSTRR